MLSDYNISSLFNWHDNIQSRYSTHSYNYSSVNTPNATIGYEDFLSDDSNFDNTSEKTNYSVSPVANTSTASGWHFSEVSTGTSSNTSSKTYKTGSVQLSISGQKYDGLNDEMKTLINLFKEEGVPVTITSGYRKAGEAGNAGSKSYHTHGGAIDVVPANGATFKDIQTALTTNPKISQYMKDHNLGYIDETDPATMKRTGATGKHFHIGPDTLAIEQYKKATNAKYGGIINYLNYIN